MPWSVFKSALKPQVIPSRMPHIFYMDFADTHWLRLC